MSKSKQIFNVVTNAGASALSFSEVSVDFEINGQWLHISMSTEDADDLARRITWATDKARRAFTPDITTASNTLTSN